MKRHRKGLGFVALAILLGSLSASARNAPELVVVVVIDQFRSDYLTRFSDYFLPARENDRVGGFNYLLQSGAVYWDAQYSHLATFTCAGHATILSGSSPAVSGIIGNNWFDAKRRRAVSCVTDLEEDAPAPRSPRKLKVSTVGDELKLANHGKSKVIAIGYKDYAVMSLGGRNASLALWFNRRSGSWVSNDYYLKGQALPGWVAEINQGGLIDRYRSQVWDRLLPIEAYAATRPDPVLAGIREVSYGYGWVFPHTPEGEKYSLAALVASPFGNDLLLETALAALDGERLGQDEYPDVLALALSSNDYVGHLFGPSSPEVMDISVRTDRALSRFLNALDQRLGLNRITLVLTSDHGVQYIPREIIQARGHAGRLTEEALKTPVEAALDQKFGYAEWVLHVEDLDLYLDHEVIKSKEQQAPAVQQVAAEAMIGTPGVLAAYPAHRILFGPLPSGEITDRVVRTFHPGRSGDVVFVPDPNWFRDANLSTTHGPPYSDNAHVPLILAGKGIRAGHHYRQADIRDIAPTLSVLLGIVFPSGSSGKILYEAVGVP